MSVSGHRTPSTAPCRSGVVPIPRVHRSLLTLLAILAAVAGTFAAGTFAAGAAMTGAVATGAAMAGAAVAGAAFRPGFIAPSQAIVRDAPDINARRVVTWRIGTPVNWRREAGTWCSVLLPGSTANRGFLSCTLITEQRPTLASVDAALATPRLSPTLENELLARRFFLSPSLETLRLVRERKRLPESDLPGPEATSNPSATLASDEAFFATLMDAFRDEVTGEDFRPVDLRINEGQPPSSLPGSSLPPVKPSLFRHPYDVFVAGRAMTGSTAKDAMSVAVAPSDDWTSRDIIEFGKLYTDQRLYVRHLEPVYPRDEQGAIAWHDAGGVAVSFARPLRAVVLARNRAILARVTSADEFFASDGCSDMPAIVRAELSGAMFSASGLLLVLAPDVEVKGVKRVGNTANPAVFDLDEDGVADVATVVVPSSDKNSGAEQTTAVLVNVAGTWRLAFEQTEVECD